MKVLADETELILQKSGKLMFTKLRRKRNLGSTYGWNCRVHYRLSKENEM